MKEPEIAKTILKRKSEVGKFTLPDVKIYDKAIIRPYKDRQVYQWNRIVSSEINLHIRAINLQQKYQSKSLEKGMSLQHIVMEQLKPMKK